MGSIMGNINRPLITGDNLPALQHNSDITWGKWSLVAGDKKSDIKYFISNALFLSRTDKHLFVGSGKKEGEEKVDAVR